MWRCNVNTSASRSEILGSVGMWYWRRTAKISWTDRVRSEVFQRVKVRGTSYIQKKEGRLTGLVTFV